VPIHSQFFSSQWTFHFSGHEYHWTKRGNLKDSKGDVIATFEPRRFSWRKVGTLWVKDNVDGEMLAVIIETAMILQYQ